LLNAKATGEHWKMLAKHVPVVNADTIPTQVQHVIVNQGRTKTLIYSSKMLIFVRPMFSL
jgi:hypothetical protein